MLKDLLEHEVGEAPFLDLSEVDIDGLDLGQQFLIIYIDDLQLLAGFHHGDVAVLEIDDLVGKLDDGAGVRSEEKLPLAYAHHQRALLARCDDGVGMATVEQGDGIGAYDLMEGQLDGRQQFDLLALLDVLDELHEHLRIGIGTETDALLLQACLDLGIVFDDAIVDDGQVARLRVVGVGVARRGLAMGGPTRVGNTDCPSCVLVRAIALQIGHLALLLIDAQHAVGIDQGHSGTIVTTIFQSLQPLDQYGVSLSFRSNVSYNTTHILFSLKVFSNE